MCLFFLQVLCSCNQCINFWYSLIVPQTTKLEMQKEWFHRHFLLYSRSHFILGKVIFSLTSSLSFSVGLSTNNSLTLHDNKETSECSQTCHKFYLILHVLSIKSLAVAIFVLKLLGLSKVYWLASYQQKSPWAGSMYSTRLFIQFFRKTWENQLPTLK